MEEGGGTVVDKEIGTKKALSPSVKALFFTGRTIAL